MSSVKDYIQTPDGTWVRLDRQDQVNATHQIIQLKHSPSAYLSAWGLVMSNKPGYFDSERDTAIVDAGGFFCQACVVGKPVEDISPDPRYCKGCYDCLLKEAEMLPGSKRPRWIPKEGKVGHQKSIQVSGDVVFNMSTVNDKKSEVDIIKPPGAIRTSGKRGPKPKALPQEVIEQWVGEGMGSKAIASRLKNEIGIKVSYKTIQRVLSGERK